MLANGLARSRVGLTTPRRIGSAVERNRVRRQLREILRLAWDAVPQGIDIVVNPRRSACYRDYQELRKELLMLLDTAT